MYITNKLPISNFNDKPRIKGHSIEKYKHSNKFTYHYRIFRSKEPYISNLYGIHINKTHHNVHNI